MSIRLRLTIWYSSILALTLFVSGIAVYIFLSHYLISNQKEHMEQLSGEAISRMTVTPWDVLGNRSYEIDLQPLDEFQYPGFFIQVVEKNMQVAYPAKRRPMFPVPDEKQALKAAKDKQGFYKTEHIGSTTLLIYNTPFYIALNKSSKEQFFGVVQIAIKINDINKVLNNLLYALALLAIIIIIAATSLGWFLARKALKPIDNIIDATDQIEKGADLAKRIEYNGPPDEIGRLTNTINSMLARIQITYSELEETNRAQRRFVSDASHELRTPLTTIRGNVDLLQKMWRQIEAQAADSGADYESTGLTRDPFNNREKLVVSLEAVTDIASEAARMSRLVNDLLSLARADSGYTIHKSPLLLLPLVEEVIRKAQLLPKNADWQTGDLSALFQVQVNGDADYLQQLLFIFIENAFKYTPSGSVLIESIRSKDQIGLRIQDTGLGMDKEEVPRIFDRFYRVDPSRGQTAGTGLGLSIAQWIIDEHNGSIEVMTRKGEGSTFIIWLPIYMPVLLK
jgi:two-component system OmpR family sensor kinase